MKMTTKSNCLISLDCQLMTDFTFDYCPNKDSCEVIAEEIENNNIQIPQCSLFYEYNLDDNYWRFSEHTYIPLAAKQLGFAKPLELPYGYFSLDVSIPELDVKKKYLSVYHDFLEEGFAKPELIPVQRFIDDDGFRFSEVTLCPPEAKLSGWARACFIPDFSELTKEQLESFFYKEINKLWSYFEAKDIYYLSYDWYIESVYKAEDYLSTYQASGIKKFIIRAYVLVSESEEAVDFIKPVICEILIEKEKCLDIKCCEVKINPDLLVLDFINKKPDWMLPITLSFS